MTCPNPQDLRRTQLQFSRPVGSPGRSPTPTSSPTSQNWDLGLGGTPAAKAIWPRAFFKRTSRPSPSTQNITYKFGDLAQWNWTYAQLTQQRRDAIAVRSGLPAGLTSLNAAQTAAVNAQDVLVSQRVNSDALLRVNGMSCPGSSR